MPKHVAKPSFLQDLEPHLSPLFESLFSLPEKEKLRHFNVGRRGLSGYFPFQYETTDPAWGNDPKEYWHLCRTGAIPASDLAYYPENTWPTSLKTSYDLLSALYLEIDRMIGSLLQDYCADFNIPSEYLKFSSGNHVMRLVHYPSRSDSPNPLVVPGHQDQTLLTLSLWNSEDAVEIKNEAGQWTQLVSPQDRISLLEGLMLERISGKKIKATEHRVLHPKSAAPRFSLLYFVHPPPQFMIRSLPDENNQIAPEISCTKLLGSHARELGILNQKPDGV